MYIVGYFHFISINTYRTYTALGHYMCTKNNAMSLDKNAYYDICEEILSIHL